MANTKSAEKAARQAVKHRTRNVALRSGMRTAIRKVADAVAAGKKDEAAAALKQAQPEMARGVARGVMHKNTASRKFSRLTKRVAALG